MSSYRLFHSKFITVEDMLPVIELGSMKNILFGQIPSIDLVWLVYN